MMEIAFGKYKFHLILFQFVLIRNLLFCESKRGKTIDSINSVEDHTQALCISAKFGSKFEFIFTSLVKNSPRLFTTLQAVISSSVLFRLTW